MPCRWTNLCALSGLAFWLSMPSGMSNHGYIYVNIDDCWANGAGSNNPAPCDVAGKVNAKRNEMAATVTAKWSDLGVQGKQLAGDLWRQKDLGTLEGQFSASLPGQGAALIRLWPDKK